MQEKIKLTKTHQLELFEVIDLADRQRYSNSIELYDAIPKYYIGKAERINGTYLEPIERPFKFRGKEYTVTINPAPLKDRKTGMHKYFYPGIREELVEDALRKISCEGHGRFSSGQMGVFFTLYELQKELKNRGHTYDINQIKDAILICANATLQLKTGDEKELLNAPIFQALGLHTDEDWEGHGKKTKGYIRFNPLVTQSINEKTYRLLNYDKCMKYKRFLSRWFHKRLSHHFTQASFSEAYSINLSTIIRDSGMKKYKQLRDNLRKVTESIEEMKDQEIICSFEKEKIIGRKKNSFEDVKFHLHPHIHFIQEVKKANNRAGEIKTADNPSLK